MPSYYGWGTERAPHPFLLLEISCENESIYFTAMTFNRVKIRLTIPLALHGAGPDKATA
jgi:hypothetical protein